MRRFKRVITFKYILVLTLAVIAVTALILMVRPSPNVQDASNTRTEFFNPIISDKPVARSSCNILGDIHYFYYSTPSDKDKRNNKFGLYIYAEVSDYFELARKLVNSNGGDWGYVLIPFNVKDSDSDRWSRVFSDLREKHLIPIIQLHDVDVSDYKKQTENAAEFLNKFVWPVKQKYVSVYNEPNDAGFWKTGVNPGEYARILDYTIETFKDENQDYFMLNGAFNVSAPNSATTMDAFTYMNKMNDEEEGIFSKLDGWASHSYPQPNFSGSPKDTGRWSIKAYVDELNYLKNSLGVDKALPVFITETGWAHAEGEGYNGSYLTSKDAAENIKQAYEDVWLKDDRVVAVTPFTIWYSAPYDHFSWINDDKVPYEQYEVIKRMKKVAGNPEKIEEGTLSSVSCK